MFDSGELQASAFAYSGSKFAVQSFTDALRNEVRAFGISVHTIDPGFFKTNLTDLARQKENFERIWSGLDPQVRDEYGREFYDEAIGSLEQMDWMTSKNTSQVVNAMEHAITSTQPRLRYILGWDHKLLWRWFAMLPSELQDLVFMHSFPTPQCCKDR